MPRRRRAVGVSSAVCAALVCLSRLQQPWSWQSWYGSSSSSAQWANGCQCFVSLAGTAGRGVDAPRRGCHSCLPRPAQGTADEGSSEATGTATATIDKDDAAAAADALVKQAARLREEAAAEAALLESQKRLRAEKAKIEDAPDDVKELERVMDNLANIRPKLRKAEAFSLPEKAALTKEVADLEKRAAELKKTTEKPAPAPAPPPPAQAPSSSESEDGLGGLTRDGRKMADWTAEDWEALATVYEDGDADRRFNLGRSLGSQGRKRISEIVRARDEVKEKAEDVKNEAALAGNMEKARDLRSKITFEKLQSMSNEERLELAKELGPAYLTSLVLVALSFWTIALPILIYAYHESTGNYPDLVSTVFSLDSLAAAGGFAASVFGVYVLLKPVRLGLAFLLTPWTVENIMPYVTGPDEEPDKGQGSKIDGKDGQSEGDGKK